MLSEEEAVLWGQWDLHFFFITRGAETGCLTLSSTKCHLGPAVYSASLFYAISLMCPYNNQYVTSTKATQMRSKCFSFFDICCLLPVSSPEKKSPKTKNILKASSSPHESAPRQTAPSPFSHRADSNETMTQHRPRELRCALCNLFLSPCSPPYRVCDLVRAMQISHRSWANYTEWIYTIRALVTQVQLI